MGTNKTIPGKNTLVDTNPELANEWHPTKNGILKPSNVAKGSMKKVWWLGKCGHEWQAAVKDRNNGAGCPYCENKKNSERV